MYQIWCRTIDPAMVLLDSENLLYLFYFGVFIFISESGVCVNILFLESNIFLTLLSCIRCCFI